MLRRAVERYRAPTPLVYEMVGDAILILSVALDGVLIAAEINYKWIIINSIAGALGKILLRLAKFHSGTADNQGEDK